MATRLSDRDLELLQDQLNQPPAAAAKPDRYVPTAPDATPARKMRRVRNPLGEAVALLATIGLAAAGWCVDGYFSLAALQAAGLPIVAVIGWPWQLSSTALASWSIPLAVEAIEQCFFPTDVRGWRRLVFVLVAGVNIAATGYGLWVVCAGKALFGLTFAEGTPALWAVAVVGGLALAFLPARFVLAALGDLWRLVR